jgi:hypothetical protein
VKRGKKVVKADVKAALAQWEKKINEINKDPAKILVENKVDLEGPPAGFTYITDYIAGKGVEIPTTRLSVVNAYHVQLLPTAVRKLPVLIFHITRIADGLALFQANPSTSATRDANAAKSVPIESCSLVVDTRCASTVPK